MDTRICRDRPAASAAPGRIIIPRKKHSKQPTKNPTSLHNILHCTHSHPHSPPPDGGGGAAPDAPEGSEEGDLASPPLPLRGRLSSPNLLPPLITYRDSSTSPRPLVIDEAELGHTPAPPRLDGVQVGSPPLHPRQLPQLIIPAKEKSSCNLGSPDGHKHLVTCQQKSGHPSQPWLVQHHLTGRQAAAD